MKKTLYIKPSVVLENIAVVSSLMVGSVPSGGGGLMPDFGTGPADSGTNL